MLISGDDIEKEELFDQILSSVIDLAEFTPPGNCAPPSKPFCTSYKARILLITHVRG
jgi:hypothetical protein